MKSISSLLEKANVLMEKNEYDEAEPVLLVALKYAPNHPEARYLLGEVYCKQRRFDESVEELIKANKLE